MDDIETFVRTPASSFFWQPLPPVKARTYVRARGAETWLTSTEGNFRRHGPDQR